MKIKNEYVKIKNKKMYEFRNTITAEYLKLFSKSQYDIDYKLKASEKAFKYVYIKTSDEQNNTKENNNKSYYNLLNIHEIEDAGDGSFSIKDFDWLNFTGKQTEEPTQSLIEFKNNNYIQSNDCYRILIEFREITIPDQITMTFNIAENEFVFKLDDQKIIVSDQEGNTLTVPSAGDGQYLFALHKHQHDELELNNIYFQAVEGITTNTSFDFRLSLIKEENTQNYIETLNFDDYQYNKYISLSSLSQTYNYRLPVGQNYYDSSNSRVDTFYTFDNTSGYYKSDGEIFTQITDINELANKKITQLGFGNEETIYAFVDVSDANIVVDKDVGLFIYRKDVLTSDAYYTGNSIPVHLSPLGYKIDNKTYYAELYSTGLGFFKGSMNEEYLIDENPIEEIDDNTFRITLEKGTNETLTPNNSIFPNINLMPIVETHIGNEIYPSNQLHPTGSVYPCIGKYKYVMYKYRLYSIQGLQTIPTNQFYVMSFYTDNQGTTRVNTKYERS